MIDYSEQLTQIGQELIEHFEEFAPIRDSGASIAFMASTKRKTSKGRKVYADCKRVKGDIEEKFVPHDYIITVYDPNSRSFNERQLKILLWHELKHIDIEYKGNAWVMQTKPHDLEDFRDLIDAVGPNWDQKGTMPPDIITGIL